MRRGARAGSGGTGRTTLLAKLVGDDKNCKWIYRFWASPGMPRGGVLPPTPALAPGSPTPRVRGSTRRSIQLNTLLWRPQSGASEGCHFLSLRRTQTLPGPRLEKSLNLRGFPGCYVSFRTLLFTHSKVGRALFLLLGGFLLGLELVVVFLANAQSSLST